MKFSAKRLLKFYRDLPIRRKFLLVIYIQIFIPLILIGFFSYRNSEDIIKKKSEEYSLDVLRMIELRLNDYINNLTVISQDLLYEKKVYDILNNDDSADPIVSYEQRSELSNIFKKLVLSRPEIQSVCIVSNSGKIFSEDDNSKVISIKDILPYDEIMKEARKAGGLPVWYMDTQNGQVRYIFLARTIHNLDNYREIGLQVILVRKEFLQTVYSGLTQNIENIAIVTSDDSSIVSRNPNDEFLHNPNFYKVIKGKEGSEVVTSEGKFISYVSLERPNWKIVSYASLKDMYRDADSLRGKIIILCVISFLLISAFSTLIAFDFIMPINKLVGGMRKVQKGIGEVRVDDDRKDELGYLGSSFNEMSSEIDYLLNSVYREQITRKEAEIKALQSQINPHFLFNTLEAINWMAQLNNVPEISQTVSDLSSLMEATIGRDDRLIPLREEIDYGDKYISLLKRRFEDRIELVKDISPAAEDIMIPRLLIQPLIENAVYHGIEPSRSNGVINLNAFMDEDHLVIEVIDNGAGIDAEELEELNKTLSLDNDSYFKRLGNKKRRSIGIENVNRRIKLFMVKATV